MYFKKVLRVFQNCFKSVSRMFQRSCKKVLRGFNRVFRKLQGSSRVFHLSFKGFSRVFQRSFNSLSVKFQRYFKRVFKVISWKIKCCFLSVSRKFFKVLSCCMALIAATRAASVGASATGHFLLEIAQSDIYHGSIMWSAS